MPAWQRWIVMMAAAKLVAALVAYVLPALSDVPSANPIPPSIFALLIVCFGGVAAFLFIASPRDQRAVTLGVILLLIAVPLTNSLIGRFGKLSPDLAALSRNLRPEAFQPYFLWTFAGVFPSTHALLWQKRLINLATKCALVIGVLLFVSAITTSVLVRSNTLVDVVRALSVRENPGYYWPILYSIGLPVFPFLFLKARNSLPDERRRTMVFIGGMAIGSVPIMSVVLAESLSPALHAYLSVPAHRVTSGVILYAFRLLVPVVTAYSVVVHRVFDVRVAIRRAVQYALARSVVAVVTVLPALALAYLLYRQRSGSVSALFQGPGPTLLFGTAVAGLFVFRVRHAALRAIDRRFFRDQYDAHQVLSNLVETCRRSLEPGELAHLVEEQVDRALHLENIAVCVLAPLTNQLVASGGKARSLSAASALVAMLRDRAASMEVRLEEPNSALRQLPQDEQEWLADGGIRLITPMLASDRTVVGLIALGEKKSELPFSQEDHLLLQSLAVSAAPKLEMFVARNRALPPETPIPTTDQVSDAGRECRACDTVFSPVTETCTVCGGALVEAPIPAVLAGKFHVERRIGSGAMGVVYQATDSQLGRLVAIKTLPKVSPSQAFRLRQEARTLAAVTHPNLVTIFGAETWRGTPLLIFEFLGGGTLTTRLASGPLPIDEAIDLGLLLSSALERIHRAGVLHRDIKPSNIGFESWGTPKLLDFGLAQIVGNSGFDDSPLNAMVGTPAYLSPDSVAGRPPDVGTDLWQLSLVLYESITGSNPMRRPTVEATLDAIRHDGVPPARDARPDCPPAVADLLAEALDRDPRRRPRSASALHGRLARVKSTLDVDQQHVA